MEFTLNDEEDTFFVLMNNIRMEYPIHPILKYCPNWYFEISTDKKLILNEELSLNGVRDFFEGTKTKNFRINNENCKTILKLAELSGSEIVKEKALTFINDNQRTIKELMEELVQNKRDINQNSIELNSNQDDQVFKELYLSKHYNEMLQYPDILKTIEISQHYKIVQHALKHYEKKDFNYRGFISFVINLIENGSDRNYCTLLSLLEFNDFDIKELERLCNCHNFDENVLNFKVINVISKIKENDEKTAKQEESIKNLQSQFEEFQKQNGQFVDAISSKLTDFMRNQQNLINDFKLETKQQINDHNSNTERMFTNQQNLINELKQQFNEQNSKIENLLNNQQNSNNEFRLESRQQFNDQNSSIAKMFTNQQNLINELKQQFNEQNSKIENLLNNQQNSNNEFRLESRQQFNDQNSNIATMFTNQQNLINELKTQNDIKSSNIENLLTNQQNSINEIKQQNSDHQSQTNTLDINHRALIDEKFASLKSDMIKEIEKNRIQNKNQSDGLDKLTSIVNNINKNTNDIESKVTNIPKFISSNEGMKEELMRKESEEKASHLTQLNKINEIQEVQKKLEKDIEQIDMYYSGMILKRDYLGDPFSGIISKLTENHGGNINDKGIISISGNRYDYGAFSSLIDYNYSGYSYLSSNDQNSFICFDFKDHCVSLSAYSLKSSNHSNYDFLKSWVVEGSNGENEWIELDSHKNEEILCSNSVIRTFHICKEKQKKKNSHLNSLELKLLELTLVIFIELS